MMMMVAAGEDVAIRLENTMIMVFIIYMINDFFIMETCVCVVKGKIKKITHYCYERVFIGGKI